MATTYNTVFQFKKGLAARWAEVNPILAAGEPGFVIDENRFKIGDGVTAWAQLPYIGEDNVVNKPTCYDFPSVGRENVIYKAESEKMIYQWNSSELKYEPLNSVTLDSLNIKIIYGGDANG